MSEKPVRDAPASRGEPVSVLVVDDHAYFRDVLRDVVAATPGMTLAGEAASGEEAVDVVAALAPRLVIMDKRMQGIGGVEAARRITAQRPGIVVILVSVEEPRRDLLAASGAVAFLNKRKLSPAALTALWEKHGRQA